MIKIPFISKVGNRHDEKLLLKTDVDCGNHYPLPRILL